MRGKQRSANFSRLLMLGAAVAFSATVQAQTTMSPEELAVRTAYARLEFATETRVIADSMFNPAKIAHLDADMATKRLHVSLGAFKVGFISELASDTKLSDSAESVQTPLVISCGDAGWQDDSGLVNQFVATAIWAPVPTRTAEQPWPVTGDGIHYADYDSKNLSRYASYLATYTLNGETRAARATILFSSQGNVAVIDGMIGGPLLHFFTTSVYPHVLLETPARTQPHIAAWVQSHTVSNPHCVADQQRDCYDAATGKIGITSRDVERSLVAPPRRSPVPASAQMVIAGRVTGVIDRQQRGTIVGTPV